MNTLITPDLYQAAFEISDQAMFISNLEGRIIEANRAATELLGWSRKEILGLTTTDLEPTLAPEASAARLILIERREHLVLETVLARADRSTIPAELTFTRLAPSGKTFLLIVARNVSSRRHTPTDRPDTNELFRLLYERAPLGIMLYDRDGTIADCNQSLANMFRVPRERVIGFNMLRSMESGAARQAVITALANGEAYFEGDYTTVLGRVTLCFQTWHKIIHGPDGRFKQGIGIFHDLTAREQARMALNNSEERLRAILDHTPAIIHIKDTEGRFIYVNRQFASVCGRPAEEILGLTVRDLYTDELAEEYWRHDQEILDSRRPSQYEEIIYHDSERRIFLMVKFPLCNPSGVPNATCGIGTDITERKEAEQRLRAALREKEILLMEVHHRVKNNLQVVISLLNMQARLVSGAESREVLMDSRDRIKAMAIVHECLHRQPDLGAVDLGLHVRTLVGYLWQAAGEKQHEINIKLDLAPLTLSIDQAVPFGLILNELLTNALKYAYPGNRTGDIRVRTYCPTPETMTLVVADDGVGLPPDFDYRRAATLGLQLIAILVETQLEGRWELGPGPGAEMILTWPLKPIPEKG